MSDKMQAPKKKGSNIYRILFCVFLLVFLATAAVSVKRYVDRRAAEKKYEELQAAAAVTPESSEAESPVDSSPESEAEESSAAESSDAESAAEESSVAESIAAESENTGNAGVSEHVDIPAKNIDWAALKAENEDVYAWLYVPGTLVDYPVLQHPDELDYYLNRNMDLSEGYPGCLYTDYINSKDFMDPNTVIYGHNMYDNLMFTTLHWYEGKEFFEEHPYFFIYTPDKNYAYKIFGAYKGSNLHQIMSYSLVTDIGIQMYFDQIWTYRDPINDFRYEVELTPESKIVTLSTCMDQDHDHRYLVQGVLLD